MVLLFLTLFVSGIVCLDIVMNSVVGPNIVLSGTGFRHCGGGGGDTDAVLASVAVVVV